MSVGGRARGEDLVTSASLASGAEADVAIEPCRAVERRGRGVDLPARRRHLRATEPTSGRAAPPPVGADAVRLDGRVVVEQQHHSPLRRPHALVTPVAKPRLAPSSTTRRGPKRSRTASGAPSATRCRRRRSPSHRRPVRARRRSTRRTRAGARARRGSRRSPRRARLPQPASRDRAARDGDASLARARDRRARPAAAPPAVELAIEAAHRAVEGDVRPQAAVAPAPALEHRYGALTWTMLARPS